MTRINTMKTKSLLQGKPVENPDGVVRRTLAYSEDVMLCHFHLKKGAHIPLHSHRAAQIGYVISGRVTFLCEGPSREIELQAGESYVFDGHERHGAVALENSEVIDVFAPAREDYKD